MMSLFTIGDEHDLYARYQVEKLSADVSLGPARRRISVMSLGIPITLFASSQSLILL